MSGSPKYTNVYYEAQRRAQLAAAARQREAERQRRIEAERQRRLAADVAKLSQRTGELAQRAGELARQAGVLEQAGDVRRLAGEVTALATRARQAGDEATVRSARKELREAERRFDRLAATVARELTTRERQQAIDMVLGQLDAVADRERLDRQGAERIAALMASARAKANSAQGFAEEFDSLQTTATEHLQLVRNLQATLAEATAAIDAAESRFSATADEAGKAGVLAAEVDDVKKQIASARAEVSAYRAVQATNAGSAVAHRVSELADAVEAELARLDRLDIVVKAATAALPRAGLHVVSGTIALGADKGVSFRAERQDGTPIVVTVHASAEKTTLEYQTDGEDFVVHQLPDGQLRQCDVTEELLNLVGEELAKEDLSTGPLMWEGKADQPIANVAMDLPGGQTRQAEQK